VTAASKARDSSFNCHQAIRLWRTFIFVGVSLQQSLFGNMNAYETHVSRRGRSHLGLPDDWAKRAVGAAGSYAGNLGGGSPLELPRGPNAPAVLGGLFDTPYRD
jgi:hypothetical protein